MMVCCLVLEVDAVIVVIFYWLPVSVLVVKLHTVYDITNDIIMLIFMYTEDT